MNNNERLAERLAGHIPEVSEVKVYDDSFIAFFVEELPAYQYAWRQRQYVLDFAYSVNLGMWYVKAKRG
jgi:hypothetical protein